MRRILSMALLGAMLSIGVGGTANAAGALAIAPKAVENAARTDVTPVRDWRDRREWRGQGRHHWGDRPHWRDRRDWRPQRHYRPHRYVNPGIRLYVEPRVYPRYHSPTRVIRLSQAHYNWCSARYNSYRARDNSWQPYNGPRRQCQSPYS